MFVVFNFLCDDVVIIEHLRRINIFQFPDQIQFWVLVYDARLELQGFIKVYYLLICWQILRVYLYDFQLFLHLF